MTKNIQLSHTNRIATALAAVMMILSLQATSQAHDVLHGVKENYDCQRRDLRKAHTAELKAIHAAYRDALAHAAASHRAAVRLCEPSRSLALAQIRAAKLRSGECFRSDLLIANKQYRLSLAELDAWYASARRPHAHQHHHQVAIVPAPQYVVTKTTTYMVPTTVTTVTPEIAAPQIIEYSDAPTPGSEWEVIAPESTGQVWEDSAIEGPVFEGPVLDGPVLQQGPSLPVDQPTPAIEFLPTVSQRRSPRPTPVTNVVTVMNRPTEISYGRPVSRTRHDHGHDHDHHADSAERTRSHLVGSLVVHALRALAQ